MPDLPTLTVSQAHFDRLVAAFPGATLAQKAESYRAWLTNRLIDRVEQVEAANIQQQLEQVRAEALADLAASLPDRQPEPAL